MFFTHFFQSVIASLIMIQQIYIHKHLYVNTKNVYIYILHIFFYFCFKVEICRLRTWVWVIVTKKLLSWLGWENRNNNFLLFYLKKVPCFILLWRGISLPLSLMNVKNGRSWWANSYLTSRYEIYIKTYYYFWNIFRYKNVRRYIISLYYNLLLWSHV